MTHDNGPGSDDTIPKNWDVLRGSEPDKGSSVPDVLPAEDTGPPPRINLLASSWADVVSVLAVCTVALIWLNAAGHRDSLTALPWAVVLGTIWWGVAATALVAIRQGTPGMLLAGIQFGDRVAPRRVAPVVLTAAACAALGGLPGLLGHRRSPLALVGGSALESVPVE